MIRKGPWPALICIGASICDTTGSMDVSASRITSRNEGVVDIGTEVRASLFLGSKHVYNTVSTQRPLVVPLYLESRSKATSTGQILQNVNVTFMDQDAED